MPLWLTATSGVQSESISKDIAPGRDNKRNIPYSSRNNAKKGNQGASGTIDQHCERQQRARLFDDTDQRGEPEHKHYAGTQGCRVYNQCKALQRHLRHSGGKESEDSAIGNVVLDVESPRV